MNPLEKKLREMIREKGRVKTRESLNNYKKHLQERLRLAPSIDHGLDISNDIADIDAMLNLMDKDTSPE